MWTKNSLEPVVWGEQVSRFDWSLLVYLGSRCPKNLIKENISLHTYLQCIRYIFKFLACVCMQLNQNVCVVLKNKTGYFFIFAVFGFNSIYRTGHFFQTPAMEKELVQLLLKWYVLSMLFFSGPLIIDWCVTIPQIYTITHSFFCLKTWTASSVHNSVQLQLAVEEFPSERSTLPP